MLPAWVNSYVGLPYRQEGRTREGCDCYGLVRLVQWLERGVDMPELADLAYRKGVSKEERLALGEKIKAFDAAAIGWFEVPKGSKIEPFDVLWLKHAGPIHFAVAVNGRTMLHVEEGADAAIEDFDTAKWKNRILGVYRHA